ncbi:MAG: hypothetical protein AB7I50_21275 [Vicinamibacterales bacterium]
MRATNGRVIEIVAEGEQFADGSAHRSIAIRGENTPDDVDPLSPRDARTLAAALLDLAQQLDRQPTR